jgi:2'-5' RNA ligase
LGEVPEDLVPRLNDALGSVAAGWPGPFRVDMGPATAWFSGARVLQVPVAGLDALAGAVRDATIPIVPLPATGDPPFVGHLTLGRAKGGGADPATRAALEGIPFLATGPVGGFDLVASLPSPAGVRYAPLAQFELNPY